jgi:putative inorganic carbon (HCO3(-)) transporter
MRDVLVTAIVLGALPFALRRPWIGVILWTWLSIMNPHRLTWGFAYDAQFAAMAAGATMLGLFFTRDKVQLPRSGVVYMLIAFVSWMVITTVFAMYPGDSLTQLEKVLKIQLMTLVALAVLHEKQHIQMFIWINAFSIGFFGFKGGLYTIATAGGGRVWGPGGFIGGNNEIGLAMLVVIPLLYYLYLSTTRRWIRYGLIVTMVLSAIAVLGTQSRGAFLAIIGMAGFLWWRSPRKLLPGVAIVLAGILALAVMSDAFVARMETIKTYQEDSSAMGRLYAWATAVNVANSRPFGAGFAMYEQAVANRYGAGFTFGGLINPKVLAARAAHSIYFQVLGEHGWIGLFLFLALWVLAWRRANRLRVSSRGNREMQWVHQLASMSQVALVGYAIGGAFLSLAYFDLPYNILVMIIVTQRWLERQAVQPSAVQAAMRQLAGQVVINTGGGGQRQ